MAWTKLGAKKVREVMGRETEYDFDPADIARQAANEITGMDIQTSPPPLRPVNVSVGTSDPSVVRTLEQGTKKRKEGKKHPRPPKKPMPRPLVPTPELAELPTPGNPKDDESLIPPKGIPGEVALGIRYNTNEFFPDFNTQRTWDSGKLNFRYKCSNVFLKNNWEAWRKLAKPPCGNPPKAEVRKSFLHYAGLELHGVKVDWSTVDLSIALNTISRERRLAARHEVYRMKVKMDGRLVEPVDPDEADKSQERKKKPASTQEGAPKRPKSEPKPKPSVPPVVAEEQGETFSRKCKEKVDGFPTQPPVDTVAEERLMTKLAVKASRLDSFVDPSLPTPTGQTSGRGSNQMSAADFTAQAKKEEEVLKAKILDLENEKRLMNERVAMMEKKDLYELLEAKMQGYQIANHPGAVGDLENLNITITRKWTSIPTLDLDKFEKCPSDYPVFAPFAEGWDGWKENCSLCVHPLGSLPSINTGVCKHMFHFNCFWKYASTRRICPTCRTALPDSTYEFFCTIFIPKGIESIDPNTGEKEVMDEEVNAEELEAGRGRHIIRNDVDVLNDNESRRFALLEVNKTLKLWRGDVVLPGVSFVTGHRSVDCELDRNEIELLYKNICNSFKAIAENLPKSNSWKEYMTDVFDSYVNPDNDPDVRPLVAGLDAEDFSAEKIPGAAVALTPYEPVLLSTSPPTKHDIVGGTSDTPTPSPPSSIPIDLTNDGLDGSSSPPPSQIVPTNAFVDLTQYISSPKNNGSKDQDGLRETISQKKTFSLECSLENIYGETCVDIHVPTAIFHVLKTFVSLTRKVDVTKIEHKSVPVDQQKDDFKCGIHVLQMLSGAGMKEAQLDRCFWVEGLSSVATTELVTSFWLILGLYLEGKLKVPPE
ncbi:hypothetical protein R1sor_008472 [Riccia sorocarpa]|uniref:RING-type domain-containing protein n=1 Tax=Riccia sorocarpa TaxID=122646 RepID=A0ABD3HVN5_9MARC